MATQSTAEDSASIDQAMAREEVVLIDVRESGEHVAERIIGALSFPLSVFDPAGLPQTRDKHLVLYCGSGNRSAAALARCVKAGVPVRSHLAGGIGAWKQAGLPTVR